MIQITCKGNSAICTRTERLTSGMVGLQCKFEFDSAWDGLAKTAVFTAGNEKRDVLLTGDTCTVPWEVLKTAGYQLVIGVYGTNAEGTLVIPTVYAMCGGIASGADPSGNESVEPTQTLVEQIMAAAGTAVETANAVKAAADAGDFKGDKGDTGPQGPAGPKGDKGDAGSLGSVTATVSNDTGTPTVQVTYDGENANFAFSGIKGERGEKGDTGATGATGATGPQGIQGPAGPQGPKGDTGAQGPQGDKGDKGDPGATPDMTAYRTAEAQDVIDAGKQDTLIQSGAAVGQIAKITAVDSNGKPTAWQAVDMPRGGHWETVLDTVWQQDVINPTAFDSATGIFTCAAGELDNLELNTEYAFYQQCTKEGVAYNTILNTDNVKVTKLSDTTFSIDSTPPTTFVPANVKLSRGACLAITDIDAKKIRLTLDGQFQAAATRYDRPFFGTEVPYFGMNTGYIQIRNAYHAYQQVTAEVESPYRIVGKILCGFNAPSNSGNFHFKNNSFCCPLVPYDMPEGNTRPYFLNSDGTKIAKLYSSEYPWSPVAISTDQIKIISGTKVKLERWVE